jgi:hypothetical protein
MNIESRSYTPMTLGNWLLTLVLLSIPVVNFVMLLVWAFSGETHPSKKTFCQASLILFLIMLVLAGGFVLLAGLFGAAASSPSSFSP